MTFASQSASSSSRLAYADSAKGLCVILVVILHTLTIEDLFNNLMFVLRMPLFFFLFWFILCWRNEVKLAPFLNK